jgi:nucleoside-diphosphate-sugar epimerase
MHVKTEKRSLPDNRRRFLVTGAAGFIGRHLVESLLCAGHSVRVLIRNPGRAEGMAGTEIFKGDLTVPESLEGIEVGIDTVIHCAGLLGKWGVPETALYDVNVLGSTHLLRRFIEKGLHRFVYISAGGVTGPVTEAPVDEAYPCRPKTAYEKTKCLAEQKILSLSGQNGVSSLVVRPTFVYGPDDPHKLSLFRAIKNRRFAFIGNRHSFVTPVYIDDLVIGILLALENGSPGEIYIIGGRKPVTKQVLVETIAAALKVKCTRVSVPGRPAWLCALGLEIMGRMLHFEPPLTRSRVSMMSDNYGYSVKKAMQALRYRPKFEIKQGIQKTVDGYQKAGLL